MYTVDNVLPFIKDRLVNVLIPMKRMIEQTNRFFGGALLKT